MCQQCRSKIQIRSGLVCPECGRRMPSTDDLCHRSYGFILAAAANYENQETRQLIHALKYDNVKSAADLIAEILAYYAEELSLHHGLVIKESEIVPIPLHTRKKRARGYNQAELIAEALVKKLAGDAPRINHALERVKFTRSQTECADYEKRNENILGSFSVKNDADVRGKTLLLLDDVFTSGATMREAARELKNAGAKRIIGLVFAKA